MPPAFFPRRLSTLCAGAIACLAFVLMMAAPVPALAQDPQVQELSAQVDRMQHELSDLQRTVYNGEAPPPGAAPPADATSAQLLVRVQQLEDELRQVTGKIEELNYRYTQLEQKVDKINADTDLRLRDIEGKQAPAAAGAVGASTEPTAAAPAQGGISPPQSGTAAAATPTAAPPAASTTPAPAAAANATPPPAPGTPGVLGTISQSQLSAAEAQGPNRSAAATAAAAAAGGAASAGAPASTGTAAGTQVAALPQGQLPAGSPEQQYQYAWGLLRGQDYPGAEAALRAFVAQHPKDPLAGNAQYWLGETYYVRKDYRQAAVAFAEGYQHYPTSAKAPDNLLKLGLALSQIGEKTDACEAFAQLGRQFPKAQQSLKDRASVERQRLGCK
jgi:tol-pal system protein YbgF